MVLKCERETNTGKLEQFLSPKWALLLLYLKAVFCPDELFVINCIHIIILLVLFYFKNDLPHHKAAIYKNVKALVIVSFSTWYILILLRGFVLYFYSQSFSKYVTPRKTMKSMALVFVVIILFLESCHNARLYGNKISDILLAKKLM